jgi:hypothetical protein
MVYVMDLSVVAELISASPNFLARQLFIGLGAQVQPQELQDTESCAS